MSDSLRYLLSFAVFTATVAGCSHSATEDPAAEASATTETPLAKATATSAAKPTPNPAAKPAASPDLANPKVTTAQTPTFNPPFPDRLDLFAPSKRAENSVRRDDEHGESVELKGFINVDQPQVVLSIDGVVSPVPEGGEKYGVQVISIQPPSVVLQRGRNRWKATLE